MVVVVGSTLDPDPVSDHIWVVLFDLNLGSTVTLAPVPFMSHLSSLWWWWVKSRSESSSRCKSGLYFFDLNLGSNLALVSSMSHLSSLWWWWGLTLDPDPAPNPFLGCTYWSEFSLYWYYVNPMLSLKFNILSHNSIPSGQIWKIPSQTGVIFSRWSFWVQQPCVVFKIEHFLPYSVYLNIICFMST